MISYPSTTTEYVRVSITASVIIGGQPVSLAFLSTPPPTEPSLIQWENATWLDASGTTRTAGLLIGPAARVLAEGIYYVWYRVTDTPEIPTRYAGTIIIT